MKKRYDYHSVESLRTVIIILSIAFASAAIYFSIRIPDLSGKIFFSIIFVLSIVAPLVAYRNKKNTYIEVSAEGILFHGWKKVIFSPWEGVREIRMLTPLKGTSRYKIDTDKGSFMIRMVEPAEASLSLSNLTAKARGKYLNELIEEIKKQAPHANVTLAALNRPL